jgi:hypothetical protein
LQLDLNTEHHPFLFFFFPPKNPLNLTC